MENEILLTTKELRALQYLSNQSELGAVQISHFVDGRDCGWIKAMVNPKLKGGGRPPEATFFKISPLGHIYNLFTGDCLLRYEDYQAVTV